MLSLKLSICSEGAGKDYKLKARSKHIGWP